MKAAVLRAAGTPLILEDVPTPTPRAGPGDLFDTDNLHRYGGHK